MIFHGYAKNSELYMNLEISDHWDTAEKAIINGGTSTRVISLYLYKIECKSFFCSSGTANATCNANALF